MKLTEALKNSGTSAIVYGESGIGKTHFCGTIPGTTLLIAAEPNGIKTLAKFPVEVQDRLEIKYLPDGTNMKPEAYAAELNKFFDDLIRSKVEYDNVVLDSATELANAMLLTKTDLDKNGGCPSQHVYHEVQSAMRRYMRIFRDIAIKHGKNIIVLALEGELVLQQTAETVNSKTHPSLSGKKLSPEIEGLFDIVAHMERTSKGERYLRLEGDDRFVAKDRFGRKACLANAEILFSGKTGAENNN